MTSLQYIKRLVFLAFVIEVTSRPTPFGSRLINFLGNGASSRSSRSAVVVGCGNSIYCDNGRRHHNQKNIGTGSDSSLVEISFQPLRELESVSSLTSFYPLAGKHQQFFDDDDDLPFHQPSSSSGVFVTAATPPNLSSNKNNAYSHISQRHFNRQRRTSHRHHRPINENNNNNNDDDEDDNFQSYHHRYPDDELSSSEGPATTVFTPVAGTLNGISYPVAAAAAEVNGDTKDPFGFMHHDTHSSSSSSEEENNEYSGVGSFPWDVFKEKSSHPVSKDPNPIEGHSYMDSDANNKRNALAAFKRQKFKSHQTQFIPSISGGAMTNLGDFFRNLKNNIEFMEKSRLSNSEEVLLDGDHPIQMLKEELNSDGTRPTGTAAFLHAIRNYRPSQRIRSLVALNPEGYHGSQFLDPNYMWLGLGKR
ncbi:uncharacterized protein LOC129907505 [Episyrphus balteatus]|uniref:uncharacterized protein LOC129907505 n=1 Tax=Episyrphus balteatus TaxID=286459 RepID=UPI002485E1E2|nr:uncharacterized protein LOC129907505 [Episyrphus balteatus]